MKKTKQNKRAFFFFAAVLSFALLFANVRSFSYAVGESENGKNYLEEKGISLEQAREMLTSGSKEDHAVIEEMVARAIDEGAIYVDGSIVPMEGDIYSFVYNTLTTDEKLYSLTGVPVKIWSEITDITKKEVTDEYANTLLDNLPKDKTPITAIGINIYKSVGLSEALPVVFDKISECFEIPFDTKPEHPENLSFTVMRIYTANDGSIKVDWPLVTKNDLSLTFEIKPYSEYVILMKETAPLEMQDFSLTLPKETDDAKETETEALIEENNEATHAVEVIEGTVPEVESPYVLEETADIECIKEVLPLGAFHAAVLSIAALLGVGITSLLFKNKGRNIKIAVVFASLILLISSMIFTDWFIDKGQVSVATKEKEVPELISKPVDETKVVTGNLYLENEVSEASKVAAITEEPVPLESYNTIVKTEEVKKEEPVSESLFENEPLIEEPVIEEPVIEEPEVIEETVEEEPVIEEPVIEEPVIEEPVVEEPVAEEPVVEEPDSEIKVITVVSGMDSGRIAKLLEEIGAVEDAKEFDSYLCKNQYDKRLRASSFEIPMGASYEELAKILTGSGK